MPLTVKVVLSHSGSLLVHFKNTLSFSCVGDVSAVHNNSLATKHFRSLDIIPYACKETAFQFTVFIVPYFSIKSVTLVHVSMCILQSLDTTDTANKVSQFSCTGCYLIKENTVYCIRYTFLSVGISCITVVITIVIGLNVKSGFILIILNKTFCLNGTVIIPCD